MENFGKIVLLSMIGLIVLGELVTEATPVKSWSCPVSLSKCACFDNGLDSVINCTNQKYKTDAGLNQIPNKVTKIIFEGNDVQELSINLFGNYSESHHTGSKEYISLARNNIETIHGKTFHHVNYVTTLDLSHNDWFVHGHERVFSNFRSLKVLKLDNTFMEWKNRTLQVSFLGFIFNESKLTALEELHLQNNEIFYCPPDFFKDIKNLKRLYISHNLLSDFELEPKFAKSLEELYIDNNTIPALSNTSMEQLDKLAENNKLKKVDISNNPFKCDCNTKAFATWLNTTTVNIVNRSKLACVSPDNLYGRQIVSLSKEEMVCTNKKPLDLYGMSKTFIVVMAVMFAIIAVLIIASVIYNRNTLKKHFLRLSSRAGISFSRNRFNYTNVNI